MSRVYNVKCKVARKGVPEFWMRVGTATEQKDGRIYLTLDALPLHSDGVMVLYPKDEKDEKDGN